MKWWYYYYFYYFYVYHCYHSYYHRGHGRPNNNNNNTTKLENLHKLILVLWNLHKVTISDNDWRTTSPDSLSQQYPILTAILSTHVIPSSTFSNAHNVNIGYKSNKPKDGHGDKTAHLAALQLNSRKLNLGGAYDSSDPMPVWERQTWYDMHWTNVKLFKSEKPSEFCKWVGML